MKTILDNEGNRRAFIACIKKNGKRGAIFRSSFSVYGYGPKGNNFGPAFYVGWTASHTPPPNERRATVRIRVYPKGKVIPPAQR